MNMKSISGFLKYSLTAILVSVIATMTPVASTLAGPDCSNPKHQDKPACAGGDITYTATLSGAFVFGPIEVFLNSKENQFTNNTLPPLDMSRELEPQWKIDTWDDVFMQCQVLLAPKSVSSFFADDWYIGKHGGVRVMFRDFPLAYRNGSNEGAMITLQLVSDEFDFVDPDKKFPPVLGPNQNSASSVFDLNWFVIWGNTAKGEPGPRRACQPPGGGGADTYDLLPPIEPTLPPPLALTITATRE